MQIAAGRIGRFFKEASEEFGAAGIHYRVMPAMDAGHIGPSGNGV